MVNRDLVRKKLNEITNQGLMLKAITRNTGIDGNDLSRFKHGMDCLEDLDVKILSSYLNCIVIPQWNIAASGTAKEISNASITKGKLQKRNPISSIDILNEFL